MTKGAANDPKRTIGTQHLDRNFRLTNMNLNTLCSCVVTFLLLVTGPAGSAHGSDDEQFGILPQPLVLTYTLEAVRGEVVIGFDLDRTTATALLSNNPGFALAGEGETNQSGTLADTMNIGSNTNETVQAAWIVTSQDVRMGDSQPYPVTYAVLVISADLPNDSRIPSGDTRVELDMWTDSREFQRFLARAGIHAKLADVTLEQVGRNWHYVLEDEYFSFQGIATPTDKPRPLDYSLPAYSTFWRRDSGVFTIYTYYGHQMQNCDIEVEFAGENDLLGHSAKSGYSSCGIFTAWKARAGIYQREP